MKGLILAAHRDWFVVVSHASFPREIAYLQVVAVSKQAVVVLLLARVVLVAEGFPCRNEGGDLALSHGQDERKGLSEQDLKPDR